jgi:hypothetical protein
MNTIVASWHRINRDLDRWSRKTARLAKFETKIADKRTLRKIRMARHIFRPKQRRLSMLEVEPSGSLGGTLDVSEERIRANIKMGHDDALNALAKSKKITEAERVILVNNFTLPSTMP